MLFDYRYLGSTVVDSGPSTTAMSFAPDTQRRPTHFKGRLSKSIPFREAISALHDVVVSDLRFKPKDRTEYKEWAAQQELAQLAKYLEVKADVAKRIDELHRELEDLRRESQRVMGPFLAARQRYFGYLYKRDFDAWVVLDPVITVHPDELFFECFSQDESTYGRLGCGYEVFEEVGDFSCGTTNVDYSAALYDEFQKVRNYKTTDFTVDPSGFGVETEREEAYKEVKIDLPDSWVRGFLQVSSAMTLPARTVRLHPMDVHNICFVLRRRKEKIGPRSMRFLLKPGAPLRILFEPWGLELECPRSVCECDEEDEIRVWGRRRLHLLERLIPVARGFRAFLLGTGLPSFFVADLGDMSFTLGLSGWTANDWSRLGNFDLMAPRAEVDDLTKRTVFESLGKTWRESPEALAGRLGLDRDLVLGALGAYTQAGRAMYDLNKQVYRLRELSREPLPMEQLRFANPREDAARRLLAAASVQVRAEAVGEGRTKLSGTVKDGGRQHTASLVIDGDERLRSGSCDCSFYIRNRLFRGPCEHMLAVRMRHASRQ